MVPARFAGGAQGGERLETGDGPMEVSLMRERARCFAWQVVCIVGIVQWYHGNTGDYVSFTINIRPLGVALRSAYARGRPSK